MFRGGGCQQSVLGLVVFGKVRRPGVLPMYCLSSCYFSFIVKRERKVFIVSVKSALMSFLFLWFLEVDVKKKECLYFLFIFFLKVYLGRVRNCFSSYLSSSVSSQVSLWSS